MPAGIWRVQFRTFFSMALGREDRRGARSGRRYPEDTAVFTHGVQAHLGLLEEKTLPVQEI
jgi:hypothetical protein